MDFIEKEKYCFSCRESFVVQVDSDSECDCCDPHNYSLLCIKCELSGFL